MFSTIDLYVLDIPTTVWHSENYFDAKYSWKKFLDHAVFKLDGIETWEDIHARKVNFIENTGRENHVLVRYATKFGNVDFVVDADNLIPVVSAEKEILCVCDSQATIAIAGCKCGAVKRERERRKNKA